MSAAAVSASAQAAPRVARRGRRRAPRRARPRAGGRRRGRGCRSARPPRAAGGHERSRQLALAAREREHRPVVVGVDVQVEEARRREPALDLLQHAVVASLADVRDRQQQRRRVRLCHRASIAAAGYSACDVAGERRGRAPSARGRNAPRRQAVLALYDPEVELDATRVAIVGFMGRTCTAAQRGPAEVLSRVARGMWTHVESDFEELVDAGEHVVSVVSQARARPSERRRRWSGTWPWSGPSASAGSSGWSGSPRGRTAVGAVATSA